MCLIILHYIKARFEVQILQTESAMESKAEAVCTISATCQTRGKGESHVVNNNDDNKNNHHHCANTHDTEELPHFTLMSFYLSLCAIVLLKWLHLNVTRIQNLPRSVM